jgi:hypothetical protein
MSPEPLLAGVYDYGPSSVPRHAYRGSDQSPLDGYTTTCTTDVIAQVANTHFCGFTEYKGKSLELKLELEFIYIP